MPAPARMEVLPCAKQELGNSALAFGRICNAEARLPVVVLRIIGPAIGRIGDDAGCLIGKALVGERAALVQPLRRSGCCVDSCWPLASCTGGMIERRRP